MRRRVPARSADSAGYARRTGVRKTMTGVSTPMVDPSPVAVATRRDVPRRTPIVAQIGGIDLVIVPGDETHWVLSGRCPHHGALLADGSIDGDDPTCGLHGSGHRADPGDGEHIRAEAWTRFQIWIGGGHLVVDRDGAMRIPMRRRRLSACRADDLPVFDRDTAHPTGVTCRATVSW